LLRCIVLARVTSTTVTVTITKAISQSCNSKLIVARDKNTGYRRYLNHGVINFIAAIRKKEDSTIIIN